MSQNVELAKLNLESTLLESCNTSADTTPLSSLEKSLDTLVQQHIDTQIKVARLKGLPYTVTDKETGTISIMQGNCVIEQRKLRGVV